MRLKKKENLSVFFVLFFFLFPSLRLWPAASGEIPLCSLLASGCRAVKGCRDCVGSRAPQLAFSHLSACLSAEMTDGRELRADGGPQRAPPPRVSLCVTHKRSRRRRKNAPKPRMIANHLERRWFFCQSIFFLSGANFTLQMFLHNPAIPPEWQKSILHFFCLFCPLPSV